MLAIHYVPGLDVSTCDYAVVCNTINIEGVMGAGVAKAFKQNFPFIMPPYQEACNAGEISPGGIWTYKLAEAPKSADTIYERERIAAGGKWMVCLATKGYWRKDSKYEWVLESLVRLRAEVERLGAKRVALPPPGCGKGNLKWAIVHEMVLKVFEGADVTLVLSEAKPILSAEQEKVMAGVRVSLDKQIAQIRDLLFPAAGAEITAGLSVAQGRMAPDSAETTATIIEAA